MWLFLLILLALVVIHLGRMYYEITHFYPDYYFNYSRLNRATRDCSSKRIIAIGNSVFRDGIIFDDEFDDRIADSGWNVDFNRFTAPGMVLTSVELLVDKMIQDSVSPDILIIQTECLSITSDEAEENDGNRDPRNLSFKQQYRWYRTPWRRKRRKKSMMENYGGDEKYEKELNPRKAARLLKMIYQHRTVRKVDELAGIHDRLIELADRGVRVLLVPMGRSQVASDYLGRDFENQLEALAVGLSQHDGIFYCQLPYLTDAHYYRDPIHFNQRGKHAKTRQLMELLISHLAQT